MCGARRTSLAGLESLVGKPKEADDVAVKPCASATSEGRKAFQEHAARWNRF